MMQKRQTADMIAQKIRKKQRAELQWDKYKQQAQRLGEFTEEEKIKEASAEIFEREESKKEGEGFTQFDRNEEDEQEEESLQFAGDSDFVV